MSKSASIVVINGRQYDATTGKLVNSIEKAAKSVASVKPMTGQALDGFIRRPAGMAAKGAAKVYNSPKNLSISKEAAKERVQRAAQNVHSKTTRSKTLMRSAVGKPAKPTRPKVSGHLPDMAPASASVRQRMHTKVNEERLSKAKGIAQHSKVQRFGLSKASFKKNEEKPVERIEAKAVLRNHAQPKSASTAAAASQMAPMPSMLSSASHQHIENLLDLALERADAHKKALKGRLPNQGFWQRFIRAPKWMSVGSSLLVVALLGGFFAYQNVPSIAMRISSTRAGINGSVPSYSPSGFSYTGPISYQHGILAVNYKANSDDTRNFSISERHSDWTSTSLLANYVTTHDQQYQTFQNNGSTIYIYGNSSNATWVNQGVWYIIQNHAHLNSDQLLNIAGSM